MKAQPSGRQRQLATGLGLAAAALLVIAAGGLFRPWEWMTPTLSPSLFPAVTLIGVAICGLAVAFGSSAAEPDDLPAHAQWRAIAVGVVAAAYAVALPYLGLLVTTLVLSVVLPFFLGYRRWTGISILAFSIVAFAWFVFVWAMGVQLKL